MTEPQEPAEPTEPAWSPPPSPPLGPPPVQVWVAGPQPQNRLTVLVRAILVIPHAVILVFLGIAAIVVAFLGWWGALFMGRLPGFATTYLTGYTRWSTRVQAYLAFLTGKYPPFTFEDVPDYPVRIATTQERLNRFAVFFRFILAIPAAFVSAFLAYGAFTIVLFVTWVITLIAGKVPATLHQAYTAVVRYQVRYLCYAYLLTPTYPVRGVFGDQQPGQRPEEGQQPDERVGQEGVGPTPAEDPQAAPADPAAWRLFLTPAAKRLSIGFLVLGIILYVGQMTSQAIEENSAASQARTATSAYKTMQAASVKMETALEQAQSASSNCTNVKCAKPADAKASAAFSGFAEAARTTPMPSNADAAASRLAADCTKVASDYSQLSRVSSAQQYTALANGQMQGDLKRGSADSAALQKILSKDKKTKKASFSFGIGAGAS